MSVKNVQNIQNFGVIAVSNELRPNF